MQHLTDQNFAESVQNGLVLIDFYAEWCGPCKMLSPVLEQLAPEYAGKISFYKVDVDVAAETAQNHGVMSVPTLVVFKDGEIVEQKVGFQSADQLKAMLDAQLA